MTANTYRPAEISASPKADRTSVSEPRTRHAPETGERGRTRRGPRVPAGSLLDEIGASQRALEEIYVWADTLPLGDRGFSSCVDEITAEIDYLFGLERDCLYPLVRRYVAHGENLRRRGLEEHDRILSKLRALGRSGAEDDGFYARWDSLVQAVRAHEVRQYEHLFPRVNMAVPALYLTLPSRS